MFHLFPLQVSFHSTAPLPELASSTTVSAQATVTIHIRGSFIEQYGA